jgi:DNA-binding NtrC family response regulator
MTRAPILLRHCDMQTNFSAAREPMNRHDAILVVDDDPNLRKCMCLMLNTEGRRTLECGSAREALALLAIRGAEVCVVVTDIEMPELNGIAFSKILARMLPDIRVLLVSGGTEPPIEPGVAFLAKPFALSDLREKISALLPSHEEHLFRAA